MRRSLLLAGMLLFAAMALPGGARMAAADEPVLNEVGLHGPEGMLALAHAAELRGDNRLAIELYRRAQEAFPWAGAPLTGWGLLAARLGAAEQAATLLTAALDIDPEDIEAAAGLAEVLVDLDRLDEALPVYEMVLRIDPSDVAAREGRLYVLAQTGTPTQQASAPALADATVDQTPGAPSMPLAAPTLFDTSAPAKPAAGALWR